LSTSSSSSLIVSNFLFPKIIEGASWQFLYYGLGGVVLCIAILCTFIVREAPNVSAAKKLITEETFFQIVRKLVHDRNYIFLTLVYFGANWGTWGVILWSNALMVKGHGFTNVGAGEVTMLIGVGGFIAKPTYGWLSDSLPFRRKTMLFPCFVGFVAVLLMFGAADTEWKFRMLAPFVGVFAFVCQPLIIAMLTEFVDKKKLGTASGVMNALGQSSTIVAPLIVGGAFQATGSFFGAFAALAVGPLLSLVCVCLIREPNRYSLR
jgi:sugar phosphate permease